MSTNNELVFTIGEETRPKIEKVEELEKSFFQDAYKKAFKLVDDMVADFGKNKDKVKGDYYQESRNNIIAFVGERGSGKTSCLQSVYQCLTTADGEIFGRRYTGFLSLPTIDPSYFEASSNILEIIIANMFSAFKWEVGKNPQSNNGDVDDACYLQEKRNLVKCFQQVKDTLDRINKKDSKTSNDSIEELSQLASGVNLKKQINNLVKNYLKFFKKKTLIIAIDDMDLQTQHAFEMAEQMRKYLIVPDVIIFVGLKLVQLKDILKQIYYKEYELLIAKNLFSDSIENIVERYIAKLLPYNQQLHLPELSDNLDRSVIIKNERGEEDDPFDSIDIAVLHLIFRKTRYMFYNSSGNKNPIIPSNLRDLWGILSLLHSMESISNENYDLVVYKNRLKFQEYFIESWCYEHLDSTYYKFIEEITKYDVSEVNKKIVDFLSKVCYMYDIRWDRRLTYYYNRPYNVSLADVDYFLDRVGRIKHQPFVDNLVFALRTVYSMLLYKTLENNKKPAIKRDKLKKKNRLYRFSDYEKLLAGELIQLENIFVNSATKKDEKTGNNVNSKKSPPALKKENEMDDEKEDGANWHEGKSLVMKKNIHHHAINKALLNELWNSLSNKDFDMDRELEYVRRLDICAFFLLTTYSTSSDAHYRSRRFPYYSYYITDVFSDKYECVYSSYAILFNICRYYYEYRNRRGRRNSSPWDTLMSRKDSLFYKILHYNITPNKDGGYENKELEQVFVRNLEILDNFQDSMPHLNNKLLKDVDDVVSRSIPPIDPALVNNKTKEKIDKAIKKIPERVTNEIIDETIDELIHTYKKMSEYSFSIYPKEKGGESKVIKFEIYGEILKFLESVKNDPASKEVFFKIFKGN